MSDQEGGFSARPDWYPDPQVPGQLRWWSGTAWTEHISVPPPQSSAQPWMQPPGRPPVQNSAQDPAQSSAQPWAQSSASYGPATRPLLGAGAPIYGPLIWIITLLPLASAVAQFAWTPAFRLMDVGTTGRQTLDPFSMFTPGYFLVLGVAVAVYVAGVVLAYLDDRQLVQAGLERPFSWAWAFLGPVVYVIGRSVVVHKVAPGRGLAPIWLLLAVVVLSIVLSAVHTGIMLGNLRQLMSTYSSSP